MIKGIDVCEKCGKKLILKSRSLGFTTVFADYFKENNFICNECKDMKNSKIIMTVGLPGSGKTFWSKQMKKDNPRKYKLVSKDDLRLLLDDGVWSKDNEDFVLEIRDSIIIKSIEKGYDVIVHDTNFGNRHFNDINVIASLMSNEKRNITVETKDFTDVPLKTCIERDALRGAKSVGKKVIMDMYAKYLLNKKVMVQDEKAPHAIISDLDGCVATNQGQRGWYDWHLVHLDDENLYVTNILRAMKNTHKIIIVSGRDGSCYDLTKKWLEDKNIPFDVLLMRKAGDIRKDTIVKEEIFNEFIKEKYYIESVIDDRTCVADMWRSLGLKTLQCGDPAFEF